MKGVETIIWDLDGTLLDSFGVFQDVLGGIVPNYGRSLPSVDVLKRNYHGSLADTINNVLGGELGRRELDQMLTDFLTNQEVHYEVVEHHLFSDALDLARQAAERDTRQVLVTNRDHAGRSNASPRQIVANSSLNGLITDIVCGDDSAHRKPKPEVIEDLLTSGRVVPEISLVIGDQFVDGEFARNLGTRAVLVCRDGDQIPHFERLGDNHGEFITVVSSLSEIQL